MCELEGLGNGLCTNHYNIINWLTTTPINVITNQAVLVLAGFHGSLKPYESLLLCPCELMPLFELHYRLRFGGLIRPGALTGRLLAGGRLFGGVMRLVLWGMASPVDIDSHFYSIVMGFGSERLSCVRTVLQ